jgi:glyoxalase family protein
VENLGGLHHVTAITGDARANVAFYTTVLGMRLVKKTVNQDDVAAYHLFYADGRGSPGTDLTFFDWPQTPPNLPGIPSIGPIALRVGSRQALEWWASAFDRLEVRHAPPAHDGDRAWMSFTDPEGQRLELVVDGGAPGGVTWEQSPVPPEFQVRGLFGATLVSAQPKATTDLLVQLLGFRPRGERKLADGGREYSFEVGEGGPGTEVRLQLPAGAGRATQGRGGVHHVAFRVPDAAAQGEWRGRLASAGLRPTPIIDRFYFKSVYFREPGGNLFEIATDGPGFTADEPLEHLGDHLALPPFLESQRTQIEAALLPLN